MKVALILTFFLSMLTANLIGQENPFYIYELKAMSYEMATAELNAKIRASADFQNDIRLKILLAELYVVHGRFESADSLLKSNENIIRDNLGIKSLLLAENHIAYAKLYQLLEYWSKFKESIDSSIEIKRSLGKVTDDLLEEYTLLPWFYQSTQNFDSAYYIGNKSIALAKKSKRTDGLYLLANAYNNHGYSFHYDMSKLKEKTPFMLYMDSAQAVLNRQPIKDILTQARIYHNIGNHLSFNDGQRDLKNVPKAAVYYNRSFDIYKNYHNPYYSALNRYVYGYSFLYNQESTASREEKEKAIRSALKLFVSSARILSADKSMDENNPPKVTENELDNLFFIIVGRIAWAHQQLGDSFNSAESVESELMYRSFYITHYRSRLQTAKIENDDLKFLSTYVNQFYQAYLEVAYKVYLKDNKKEAFTKAYLEATNVKNYLSYVNLTQLLNKPIVDIKLEDIQAKLLDDKTAIIDYFTFWESNLIVTITNQSIDFIKVENFGELTIGKFIEELRQENLSTYSKLSYDFYAKMVLPALDKLPSSIKSLVIIPDILTNQIPFESLNTQKLGTPEYLIEKYEVKYGISIPIELLSLQREITSTEFMITSPLKKNSTLIFSERLVNHLSDKYASKQLSNYISKAELMEQLQRPGIVHISSHMTFGSSSFEGQIEMNNDTLKQRDISKLKMTNLQLAILHGCRSSIGADNANGYSSLSREFIKQGAGGVVQSLWDIDDRFSSNLLEVFYGYLEKGFKPSVALRNAKLDMLNHPEAPDFALPWNWSGLVFYGQDMPILMERRGKASTYYFMAVVLLLLTVTIFRKKLYKPH